MVQQGEPFAEVVPGLASELATIHAQAFSVPWSAAQFQSLLDLAGVILIAQPGGFILVRTVADEAEILTLAVVPDRQRQGLGTHLVAAAGKAARDSGATILHLEVADTNTAALALYRRTGFVQSGCRRGYYTLANGERADAITMTLALTGPLP